jgi:hypothetical protein
MYDEIFYIGTTRFNNMTFEENIKWRKKHNHNGCIYGLNKRIADSIPNGSLIYILEMNNDINRIMGIGLIRKKRDLRQNICIYRNDLNYNRFYYHSNERINASDIKYQKMLKVLESIVFKGSRHMKRGQGITVLSWSRFKLGKTRKIVKLFFKSLFNQE